MRRNRWLASWMLLSAIALATGCLESQPPVDRVQPNVTRKSDIAGAEWYFLQTVVDTPYSTDFTFVGEQGQLERIEWEIQEDFLVARRSYEHIDSAEPEGINGSTDQQGAVVAMYAIDKHFDIRREYNPVTGEELNIIVENDTDRPWHQREYMRVDWSENLVTNPSFLMLNRYFDGLEMEPVAWFVQDEDSVNAPVFERLDPNDDASAIAYMDITNKMFVRPTEVDIPGLGPLPSCFILQVMDGNPIDCTPQEITVRNSFLRVSSRDYQPHVYSGDRMDRAGYFITERPGYDRAYGLVEPARYRFANRHNLWAESHRYQGEGEERALVRCTADADCADGRGSVCDLDLGRAERRVSADGRVEGACTIPFRDRDIRPIAYFTSLNFDTDLLPEARALADQWNRAFVETVASLREQECLANGGTDCASERTDAEAERVFVLCESPVAEGAHPACGPAGTVARIGDLRHHLLGWVNEPHRASPLGYGPSAADPLTGEIIMANAFLYGAGVDSVSAFGRDIVRVLNGDLSEQDIISSVPVDAWIERTSSMSETAHPREAHAHATRIDAADLDRLNEAMDFSWVPHVGRDIDRGAVRGPAEMIDRMRAARERLTTAGALGNGAQAAEARIGRLVGTDIERLMTTPEISVMAGLDPATPLDEDALDRASPLRGMSLARIEALRRMRDRVQRDQGIDFGEFGDEGLLGLARAVQRAATGSGTIAWNGVEHSVVGEGGRIDYEAVRQMMRHPILYGLALHEVGHTVGLRHNFSGSYDAVNYRPEYWQLRDDGSMAPRAWDPLTQQEIDGRIHEYAYSTVMDYGHNFVVTDSQGLGHYDHAAIKLGYGDLVEVFETTPNATELAWANFIQGVGWPINLTFGFATGGQVAGYEYTDWPGLVGGRENLERRADVPYTSLRNEALLARSGLDARVVDAQGRVNVPYRFCSDEQADLGPTCMRYDMGADAYETVQSIADSYWNYYIFNNYRRRRLGFNVEDTATRIHGRYFEKLKRANQIYALYRGVMDDAFGDAPGFDTFWTRQDGMGAWTLASGAAYETLLRVVTAPQPGGYTQGVRGDGTQGMLSGGMGARVDGFDGRQIETTWDFEAGYFWFDQLERVGYFYDKILALMTLADPTTYFIGRDTDADIRRYQLSFASTFGPSMTRFYGGLLAEDWRSIAPRVQGGEVVYPDPLEIEDGDMDGVPLDPSASFSIQLYAAVYGMSLIPQTYDQDFLNRSRVWVRGSAEEIQIDPSLPTVEFTNPDSGLTYAAVSYMEGGVEHGTGALMIERARTLASRARTDAVAAGELRAFIDNLDIVRRLTWELGFGAQP